MTSVLSRYFCFPRKLFNRIEGTYLLSSTCFLSTSIILVLLYGYFFLIDIVQYLLRGDGESFPPSIMFSGLYESRYLVLLRGVTGCDGFGTG